LFIGDRTSRSLSAFSVDPATGGVTLLAGYPKPGGGADIVSYPVPNAPFLYAADRPANLINGFQVGPNASTRLSRPAGGRTNYCRWCLPSNLPIRSILT
jgi:6-phosphogluconolactonase (cycloisomerase 2 family)